MKKAIALYLICLSVFFSKAQTPVVIPLYEGKVPNSRPYPNHEKSSYERESVLIINGVSEPTLSVFLPPKDKATGAAVIICPGGGYAVLAFGYEGTEVAQRFTESGITAFVLKYRLPDDLTMENKEIGPLQDAQRAIQLVRSRAAEWQVDPKRIGIMGFSAGGHLASTAGTHFGKKYISNPKNISLRPDFMVLVYPVISFQESIGHMRSAHKLLGPNPTAEKLAEYSNEKQVTGNTPPSFLVHAKDDAAVPYANSIVFAEALKKNKIREEVFLYDQGGHGFGMNNPTSSLLWMDLCIDWLRRESFLKP